MTRLILLALLGSLSGTTCADISTNATQPIASDSLTDGDYTFRTNAAGHAVIIAFNKDYSGELLITNMLGGCPVAAIEGVAFGGCAGLTGVTIPSGVSRIAGNPFAACASLIRVAIGNGLTSGVEAIATCSSLEEITVAENNPVYSSVDGVLFNKKQTELILFPAGRAGHYAIPDSVTCLGNQAFFDDALSDFRALQMRIAPIRHPVGMPNHRRLTSIIIPHSVTGIGTYAFYNCMNLTNLVIGKGVSHIERSAFEGCAGLASVTIPDSVITIGRDAFGHCTNLASVTIPNSVTSIEVGAFDYTGMTNYIIGRGVTNGGAFFFDCRKLANITVAEDNPIYSSVDGVLFNKEQTALLKYPTARSGDYTIPNSVNDIAGWAFAGCTGLTSVTIPESVTRIGGANAFSGCTALTSVTIPDSVTNIGNVAFSSCAGLTNVTISGGDVRIGEMAFSYCTNLVNLALPVSVTNIGFRAFSGCVGLTNRPVETGKADSARNPAAKREGNYIYKTRDGRAAITGFNGHYAGPLSVADNLGNCPVTSIEAWGFMNCTGLTHVTIHAGITTIRPQAFTRCPSLIGFSVDEQNPAYRSTDGVLFDKGQSVLVKFPGGRVGNYAIPETVASIGYWGFKGCGRLASVAIPASVTNIGSEAFDEMPSLTAITVAEGNSRYSSVDGVLFNKDRTALVQFPGGRTGHYMVPDGVTSIQGAAFAFCRNVERVTIPASVTNLGRMAFYDCWALTELTFEGNAPKIADYTVFDGCGRLTVYYRTGTTGWGPQLGGRPIALWQSDMTYKPVETGTSQTERPDDTGYQDRRRQRMLQKQQTVPPQPVLSPKEMEKHLQNYQMEAIRKGVPPLPISLTKEIDDQLVKEGILPPEGGGPVGVIRYTQQTNSLSPGPENRSEQAE